MKCLRCGFINEIDDDYCNSCGQFLGIMWDEVAKELDADIPTPELRDIFKLPKFMWLDELIHRYTKFHEKYRWTRKHCEWVQMRLEHSSRNHVDIE